MALSTSELTQCKFYLGYTALTALARPYFDIALVFENVIQQTLEPTFGEGYVRNTILANLAQLDIDIQNCRTRFQASELVGDVKLNKDEFDQLVGLRQFWVNELSRLLGVPVVPSRAPDSGSMEVW